MEHKTPDRWHGASQVLSKREAEVTAYLVFGFPVKEIASRLFIAEKTVKYHSSNIYKKLNVSSKAVLVAAWHRNTLDQNLIEPVRIHAQHIFDQIALDKKKCFLPYGAANGK